MPRLVIPGGSGYLGLQLAQYFSTKGWEVFVLSRRYYPPQGSIQFLEWDGKTLGDWAKVMEGADVVVNMAGRTVNCRYNATNKKQILDSRIDSTRIIGKAIAQAANPPKLWLNSSSATIYQDTRGAIPANDEYNGKIGTDFSMNICKAWEKEFMAAVTPSVRKIALRTAIVIGKEPGGAMEYLINLTKFWLGGTQGSGQQFISWVHLSDFIRVVDFLIGKEHISGIINVAAPQPVTNQSFMAELRKAIGRSWGLPMPKVLLELGAVFLGTQTELVLKSRKVVSTRLKEEGFQFEYERIEDAFKEICTP
ncbi:TIGR01777 family oxidoreductase [Aureispira anguillae]|uniref:TIGR01777 family oxidoreductase n=1 Tax=Aureispira anguillae TaxID=2864201 RepID=A0A915YHR2_9BACT|nr:TIGR01777 family oxidoreductase [Aureispira anguillae]BDS13275.1 TIGR01777 family oxidoreductase [Aureispira anguillae]